ncbi:hypothetical protein [uncultured Treponema sp.]|uniref:hypothetical protein n=1 Tax=uncultured Treponema sp. TaxID=162155 RepID=UPI002590F7CD|nr:hypothetical protein [uncultured Treponema sp.]
MLGKYISGKSFFTSQRAKKIEDYVERVRIFYEQVCVYFAIGFTEDEKLAGEAIEQQIDETRKEFKKSSRKRLDSGADVKRRTPVHRHCSKSRTCQRLRLFNAAKCVEADFFWTFHVLNINIFKNI